MYSLNCNGKLIVINQPIVMGIINITPDSFHAASRQQGINGILKQAEKMLTDGATMLDIGGQSTRPGAAMIGLHEEIERVVPAIEAILQYFPKSILSIDTFHAKVAKASVEAGCSIVNDVSGGTMDEEMLSIVANLHVPYICMHIKGTPADMQQNPQYKNVVQDVLNFFIERTEACRLAGIHDVIIDPGIGFGKNLQHNFTLLQQLSAFKILGKPILLGVSRKSFIRKILEVETEDALNGTTVLHTIGLMNGANILRVHDVKEAVEAVKLYLQVEGKY